MSVALSMLWLSVFMVCGLCVAVLVVVIVSVVWQVLRRTCCSCGRSDCMSALLFMCVNVCIVRVISVCWLLFLVLVVASVVSGRLVCVVCCVLCVVCCVLCVVCCVLCVVCCVLCAV